MEFKSYNAELGICSLQFSRIFSNIQIERTDNNGNTTWLKIPCVNEQRSRILKSFQNKERLSTYKLPMISFQRTGYSRQGDRLNELHNEVKYEMRKDRRDYQKLTPVPIDIDFQLTVYAKYQADIDKIASNFMVFFNNDIYVSQEHPKYQGKKVNSQIVMQDGVSEDHPFELDGAQDDFITATFNFTFKTYLYGGTQKAKLVKKILVKEELSTVVSSYVHEFETDEEILDYLKQQDHARLSTILTCEAQVPVSSVVSTDIDEYDDGIPKINIIDFGFYTVPKKEDFVEYMTSVDNEQICKHVDYYPSSYISSEEYIPIYEKRLDDEGHEICVMTALSTKNDYYENIDMYCSLAPYVDRIKWSIDDNSPYDWPYNVLPRGHFEDLSKPQVISASPQ